MKEFSFSMLGAHFKEYLETESMENLVEWAKVMEKDIPRFTDFVAQFSDITRDSALKKWKEINEYRQRGVAPLPAKEKPIAPTKTVTTVIETPKIELKDHLKDLNKEDRKTYDSEKLRVQLEREKSDHSVLSIRLSEKDKEISALRILLAKYEEDTVSTVDFVDSLRRNNDRLREENRKLQNKVYNLTKKNKKAEFDV